MTCATSMTGPKASFLRDPGVVIGDEQDRA